MAKYSIEDSTLTSIANAIRDKTGSTEPILTEDMAQGVVDAYDSGTAYYKNLMQSIIDRSVTEIREEDFVASRVYTIGNYAFYGCGNLKKVVLPPQVQTTYSYAFQNCKELESVITNSMYNSYYTYAGCENLRFVQYKQRLFTLYDAHFQNCSKLAYVSILSQKDSVPLLGNANAFGGVPKYTKIVIPNAMLADFRVASNWSNLANRLVGTDPNDEIGIIDINMPDGTFATSFCFVKGMLWYEVTGSDFGYIFDNTGAQVSNLMSLSGDVLFIDNGSNFFYVNDVNEMDLVVEGTYTLTSM